MLKVGLTGNIAAGKSTVVRIWRSRGALVIEADKLARRAVEPGTTALRKIVQLWGPEILLPSGALDRAALGDIVFRDAKERRKLEKVVHPEVDRLHAEEYQEAEQKGLELIAVDVPLLFEVGREGDFDVVVLIEAPEELRRERLKQRGLADDAADRMIQAQWPSDRKHPGADIIIENAGSIPQLEARASEVWSSLKLRARAQKGRR